MHIRFSNKIPKYSRVSVPISIGQKSPAEQWFVGGVFALSVFYIGKVAGLLHCLRVSALFALRLFWFIFNSRWLWSVGIRCFLWLQVRFPVRSLVLSPALCPALSPTWSRSWSPTSTSWLHRLVRLVIIFRCKLLLLHTRTLSAYTSGSRLSLHAIHSPALRRYISALEASAASAPDSGAWALETSALETLAESSRPSALPALDVLIRTLAESSRPSALPALDVLIRTLAVSTQPSASPAPDVLIRTLAVSTRPSTLPALVLIRALTIWTIGASWSP
jgi:hypothetical protein